MKRMTFILCLLLAVMMVVSPAKNVHTKVLSAPDNTEEKLKNSIVLYVGSPNALVNNADKQIDAENANVKPVVKNDRTLVPVKFISENLGARVDWDDLKKEVTVTLNSKVVKMMIGDTKMSVNGKITELDVPAEIIGERTFIPLRKLVEALDKKVFYDRGLIVISEWEKIFDSVSEKQVLDNIIARVNNLPVVGSYDNFKDLLKQAQENSSSYFSGAVKSKAEIMVNQAMAAESTNAKAAAPQSQARADASGAGAGNDFSKTNIQVEGVDEADVVKTDGQYIYQVNNQRIVVASAYPAEEMKVLSIVNFKEKEFYPQELYVDGQQMIVIGATYSNVPMLKSGIQRKIYPPVYNSRSTVKAIVYDISDRTGIKQLREIEVEGYYVSSRKIGSALYLVANKNMNYYIMEQGSESTTPSYRDTAVKEEFISLDYPDIRYFPGFVDSNYMIVAGVDLSKPSQGAEVSAYLGVGQNIYVSQQNLYITATSYKPAEVQPAAAVPGIAPGEPMPKRLPIRDSSTLVYKFSLNNGKATYLNKGEVPGTVLNQFSMDEKGKYFRIATTGGEIWRSDQFTSRNNVYILDEMLNITGRLENLAPGEKIYSVRFMGDRGYVVTFKTVDPLFVIDLKNPSLPAVLGALKIPGFSDYLHPYDENHIIGFGKDTVEMERKDRNGNITGTSAYYLGMKLALFDVTDVNNPIQKFVEKIGDRGTDSELLRNHKALLFSKDKNLLAFPVTVMEVKNGTQQPEGIMPMPAYGQFTFQGAYVYNFDLVNGFRLKGRITHLSEPDYTNAGNHWYGSNKNVERILYINDTLYTLSKGMFKANSLTDLKELKTVVIP